ncbi:MAG: phenylalanine--tRNA ligase subunit alpha, partial [Bacteroidota bacterium]|nr:phenylalanine--tRNA ligase subunit alpha [Bacteroidota bacterium]
MLQTISETNKNFSNEISQVSDLKQLENLRIKYLSRKGIIATLFEDLKTVPKEDKPAVGKSLNELRNSVQTQFDTLKEKLEALSGNNKQAVDFTLPGRGKSVGSKHILIQTLDEIKTIFRGLGFSIAEGPELESDYNNFSALNFAPDHPARDMQDTFFINKDYLLRTHTSPVQIRVMQNQQPPVRAIMPGKVYRNEAISARSYCLFHQVEGLCVDKGVTFAELKGTLVSFA